MGHWTQLLWHWPAARCVHVAHGGYHVDGSRFLILALPLPGSMTSSWPLSLGAGGSKCVHLDFEDNSNNMAHGAV